MYKTLRVFLISLLLIGLIACATQQNIPLSDNFWQTSRHRIVIATASSPVPQLYGQGNQDLLDIAIMDAANKNMDSYLKTIDLTWYRQLPAKFAQQLKQRHITVRAYPGTIADDQKNYSTISQDKLLIIHLDRLGAVRNYYGFIPSGAPQAYCVMHSELINAVDHKVLWRYHTVVTQPIQGNWDQAPNYPNLTQALQQAIHSAQQELMDSLFSGH